MFQDELKTPFSAIHILRNGQKMQFTAKTFDYGMFMDDGSLKRPQGLYLLYPDMAVIRTGDVVSCEFDGASLIAGGGDEFCVNLVGTYEGYSVAVGAKEFQRADQDRPDAISFPPYETDRVSSSGIAYRIVDDPKKYESDRHYRLLFLVAWEPGETNEAWDLVEYVTC